MFSIIVDPSRWDRTSLIQHDRYNTSRVPGVKRVSSITRRDRYNTARITRMKRVSDISATHAVVPVRSHAGDPSVRKSFGVLAFRCHREGTLSARSRDAQMNLVHPSECPRLQTASGSRTPSAISRSPSRGKARLEQRESIDTGNRFWISVSTLINVLYERHCASLCVSTFSLGDPISESRHR